MSVKYDDIDDMFNNLVAAGAVLELLSRGQRAGSSLVTLEVVVDSNGNATNMIDVGLKFMRSQYRLTVDRVPDDAGLCFCWQHIGKYSCPVHPWKDQA